jgi:hypothetical protein
VQYSNEAKAKTNCVERGVVIRDHVGARRAVPHMQQVKPLGKIVRLYRQTLKCPASKRKVR